ncbi:MAG: hypothetical protein AB1705_26655, partial [Verrucomicrobiota bacterium]
GCDFFIFQIDAGRDGGGAHVERADWSKAIGTILRMVLEVVLALPFQGRGQQLGKGALEQKRQLFISQVRTLSEPLQPL